ncbi:lipoamide dehydrogenase, E3 component is part of three enzyme complexes(Dihydrolipoamide dehydrogenase,1-468) [Magnetospirillum sp. XM-1]|uniref:dihydrolipoyl dehydrogenase n=1 Tax=Magnetospirillum sp. XM-1 TaxID=1663591 RepID=UPI00073DD338|nr:dihydrolipoyl dehydrogenase [Magnetospirillum sp. XM-1]CUW38456.1 lipoamide dehydrogenase, E3 component is part of three enzyme complexes(Dihydrolipoamide dehydrogenase,1-468) [Magnetospirillum sp. XM-1]
MSENSFDVVIIGGGPGGYVAAIRAAQLGLKTACIEKRGSLGGTCLNVGCIPSKALLTASHHYHAAAHEFGSFGIKVSKVEMDVAGMMGHKDKVVSDNTKGIEFLFKKNKVTYIVGAGAITAPGQIEVTAKDGAKSQVAAKHIVIATGSDVTPLPGVEIDEEVIISSTGALALPKTPKHMVVIGGGVIGLELGTVWGRLGAKVTVVEFLDRILPFNDGEVSKQMQRLLGKQGMEFKLGTKVTGITKKGKTATVTVEPAAGGAAEKIEADCVLVAIGRKPYTDGLGLDKVGVAMDKRGFVQIDGHFRTNVPGIYAIGDVVGGAMLAHKAEEEGVALAEILAGQHGHVNYDAIPAVVYTWPEVASVGKTEEQLKAEGIAYKAGKFPFTANGRARSMNEVDGFVKVLACATTDKVLGAHIVGPNAGDLIAEVVLAMEFGAASEDIARTCHAHPGLGEAVKEACLAVDGRPLHT